MPKHDNVSRLVLHNAWLRVEIAPEIGGRICSLQYGPSKREFLWRNAHLPLQRCAPDSDYDSNFYGGMDELLPNDPPETVDGIPYPDHGELWTMPLAVEKGEQVVTLWGRLVRCGLIYERRMHLEDNRLVCAYRITNDARAERHFMWKLHAALAIQPGDRITCPARTARAVDAAWSRQKTVDPFAWPHIGGVDVSVIPPPDGTKEFLYLYDLAEGRIGLQAQDGASLECNFDPKVFPCCWYFASYGAMGGAYTGVLEPCTNMPISVNEAAQHGVCAMLAPRATLATTVIWTASHRPLPAASPEEGNHSKGTDENYGH